MRLAASFLALFFGFSAAVEPPQPYQVLVWAGDTWSGIPIKDRHDYPVRWPVLKAPNYLGHDVDKAAWNCPVQCEYWADKTKLSQMDAVIFEGQPLAGYFNEYKRDIPNLPQKHRDQLWVNLGYEQEKYFMFYGEPGYIRHIDVNMTFHQESQVPITFTCLWGGGFGHGIDDFLMPPGPKSKERGVLFIATNCQSGGASFRTSFVRELMKHIQIDSYGQCLHNKDLPQDMQFPIYDNHGQSMWNKVLTFEKYMFVLALENNNITDYVSEKVINVLQARAVPIYMGSENFETDWAPGPKSVVNVRDFKSTKDLAEHLKFLINNEEEYMKYFEWKKRGLSPAFKQRFSDCMFYGAECRLCQYVHKRFKSLPESQQQEIVDRRKATPAVYQAVTFDGSSQHILVPSSPRLDLAGEFSIGAWVRPHNADRPIADRGGVWTFRVAKHFKPYFELCVLEECFSSAHPLVLSDWAHVVVTYRYAPNDLGAVQFFVNGQKEAHTSTPKRNLTAADYASNPPLLIAANKDKNAFFAGEIDDLVVFDHALSDRQAGDLQVAIPSGSEPGLVAYYGFNQPRGDTAKDAGPYKLDGALQNSPNWVESITKPLVSANPCF